MEPNVETLRYSLSAEFCMHCVLSGVNQRCASTPERRNNQEKKYKFIVRPCAPAPRLASR